GGGGGGGSGGSGGGGGGGAAQDSKLGNYRAAGGSGGAATPGNDGSYNGNQTWPPSPIGGQPSATGGTGGNGGTGGSGGLGGNGGKGADGGGAVVLAARGLLRVGSGTTINVSAGTPQPGSAGSAAQPSPQGPTNGSAGVQGQNGGRTLGIGSWGIVGVGGRGGDGGQGGNGAAGAAGGTGGAGGSGGYATPGMVKLHGSVVLAGNATVVAANPFNADPDRNGAVTVISNMNASMLASASPQSGTASLVQGAATHDPLLKMMNPFIGGKTPVIPELAGGPDSRGWLKPNYWNNGVENPPFNANNGLEFRVLRVADGSSPFEGFDQVLIRNTNSSGNIENVSLIVGVNVPRLIDGSGGTPGVLGPGQTWSTTVPAGAYVNVPGASGDPGDGPVAQFMATPTAGARPLVVQFVDQSLPGTGTITSWLWHFGDGDTSTDQNPSHTYTASGLYTVSLTVQTDYGMSIETKADYILVTDPVGPTAIFSGGPTSVLVGDTVYFGDQSLPGSLPIQSWLWDFGDGQTSTLQSPSHTYNTAGTYTVTLTVSTGAGSDNEVKSNFITVNAPTPPTADFDAWPLAARVGIPVQFYDLSTAGSRPITAWQWDFGDGETSTDRSPRHAYAAPGTYTISLTVTATDSTQDSITRSAYVLVTAPDGPSADFTAVPATGNAPLTVQFVDLSIPGNAPITEWLWNFGDGQTSIQPAPQHTYANPGSYAVTLRVTTALGVSEITKPNFVVVTAAGGPTADFTAYPRSGKAPLSVQFADRSIPGDAPIVSRLWDFGDGFTSAEAAPLHTYNVSGSYNVTLTVTDTNGRSNQITRAAYVAVGAANTIMAAFTSDTQSGSSPLTVRFTDQSTPGQSPITGWLWNFGDGETSTEQNPTHVYAEPGEYTVTLTVTSADGADTMTRARYITVVQGVPAAGGMALLLTAALLGVFGARFTRRRVTTE
ncbi:MAG TPA: PKD domain-containing protein, partial [Candidatus Hydrogenedentes bacterium]|nr:PKD domain-containing protein [Candidatus Hydrogenedentota bacterium]